MLYALDQPDASLIKELESRVLALGVQDTVDEDLKTDQRVPLNEALWVCQQELRAIEKESFAKRLFIFTDWDSAVDENDRELSEKRADDLAALDVNIELFPLPAFNQDAPNFDIKKFFANLITFDEDDIADGLLDVDGALTKLGELSERIKQREFKKRVTGKCSLEVTAGKKIALSFYSTVMKARRPAGVTIHA